MKYSSRISTELYEVSKYRLEVKSVKLESIPKAFMVYLYRSYSDNNNYSCVMRHGRCLEGESRYSLSVANKLCQILCFTIA